MDEASGRVLLVTGGGRGIGAATARLAASKGWTVAVNYTANSLAADEVVRGIRELGGSAITVQADVADEAQVIAMFQKVDARLGRLSGLVNNAGVVDVSARVDEMSLARIKRMFDINVIGSMLCAREAVRRMSTKHGGEGGAIVNVSSAASRLGSPGQYVDYAAAKGMGIDDWTRIADEPLAGIGGMGLPFAKKPLWTFGKGKGQWGEVTSASNCTDYQARRLNARFKVKGEKGTHFVHTLNGTAIAVSRAMIALLENHQQADGTVVIPDALRPYLGGQDVIRQDKP